MNENVNKIELSEEKEGKVIYLADIVRGFMKFWWVCVALMLLFGGLMFVKFHVNFVPIYKASATFTVDVQNSDVTMGLSNYSFYYKKSLASQLSKTFPYILQTNLLQDAIKEDLDLETLDVSLSAEAVSNSNMFTLYASGHEAQRVYDVMLSAIENYPNVAHYTVGNIKLNMITEPQLPTKPTNSNTFIKQTLKGMVIGLFIGIVWIMIYAFYRKTIRTKNDIKNELNQEILGIIPKVEFKKYNEAINRAVLLNNKMIKNDLNDSVSVMRNSLIHKLDEGENVIMITSTAPSEGKTTVAANLAMSIAMTGKKVLLIDCDLRNPNVNAIFGMENPADFNSPKPCCIKYHENLGISTLNFNVSQRKIWKIIRVDTLKKIISGLRDRYDYILIDTPPCGLISDASIIAQASDAVVYVVFQDVVRVSRIRSSFDGIMSTGTKVLGCVLNGASYGAIGYSGSYGYRQYGYGYGYGRYGYSRYGYGRYGYNKYGYGNNESKNKSKNKKKK